jgi:hypothetical protein
VCRLDIGPKDHAQAPPEVVGQRVLAAGSVINLVAVASNVIHRSIIRAETRSVVDKILCLHDDLLRIQFQAHGSGSGVALIPVALTGIGDGCPEEAEAHIFTKQKSALAHRVPALV